MGQQLINNTSDSEAGIMNWLKKLLSDKQHLPSFTQSKELPRRVVTGALLEKAASPFVALTGGKVITFISDRCEWQDIPSQLRPMWPNQIMAFLLGVQESSGLITTLVFHDGLQDHGTGFLKIAGSPSRVYFRDPHGEQSLLCKGNNQMGISSREEADGSYSVSWQEFEAGIAAAIVCTVPQRQDRR